MQLKLLGSLCPWLFWTAWAVPLLLCSGDDQSESQKLSESENSAPSENYSTTTVRTLSGLIRGSVIRTESGKLISRFLGVPYGQPPVDSLRFRVAQMVKPWTDIFEAFTLAKACFQYRDKTFPEFEGTEIWNANTPLSEDCLNMNIWAPSNATNLPTLVWIYGGGFIYGSPSLDLYDGQTLAAEGDVIVININYRIGPFGFLYFLDGGQESAPGNMGLADQQLAMRWVHENIIVISVVTDGPLDGYPSALQCFRIAITSIRLLAWNVGFFGGNPDRITIFGESAGAAGVSAHLFAKDSWKYFSYAILQSGTITSPWAYKTPEKSSKHSSLLAKNCSCTRNTTRATVDCLRALPATVLQLAAEGLPMPYMEFPFAAVSRDDYFFKGDIFQLMKEGQVKNTSILIGSNSDEGTFWLAYLNEFFNKTSEGLITKPQFDLSVAKAFPNLNTLLQYAISYHYQSAVLLSYGHNGHRIRHDKRGEATLYRDALKRMIGDYFFTCDVLDATSYLTRQGCRTYSYFFTERSTTNPWPIWMGVMHAYEIEYVFGVPIRQPQDYTQKEVTFSRFIIRYWSNFARNGMPLLFPKDDLSRWPVYGEDRIFMNLNSGGDFLGKNLLDKECELWRNATTLCRADTPSSSASTFVIFGRPAKNSGFQRSLIFVFVIYILGYCR